MVAVEYMGPKVGECDPGELFSDEDFFLLTRRYEISGVEFLLPLLIRERFTAVVSVNALSGAKTLNRRINSDLVRLTRKSKEKALLGTGG